MKNKPICIGKIATAHGVKGLIKIISYAEDESLLEGDEVYLSEALDKTVKITLKNKGGKYWIGQVSGVQDRNDAELLRGKTLWISRDKLPEPEEDEFYIEDLIGLPVKDMDGHDVGEVLSVQNFGAGDLLEIKPPEEPSFYQPFTKKDVPEIASDYITIVTDT